ncbi:MAG TPA: sulfite exporter TauE/SafE family protein [Candidatus Limnocylindrales bacterium]|nr:sulfite exporter TauE/SafE family protein [Candidatus Limnocylindrales bacterium]
MQKFLLIVAAGLGAGFINAVAGGGSLISFPALFLSGLPAVMANATSTVALWPGSLASVWAYRLRIWYKRKQAMALALPSLLGGLLGSVILLHTPEKAFRLIVPYLILLACALLVVQGQVGRWVTRRTKTNPKGASRALWIVQFLISVYGGYFGAGIGILMLAAMAIFMPEDLQSANALKVFFATLINGIAAFYFILTGAADLGAAGIMAGASIVGGYAGARLAQRLPPKLLRAVVVGFGIIIALRLF